MLRGGPIPAPLSAASGEGRLSVALDDGRAVTVAQGHYGAVDHGYATTIHKSQGATVERAFVLASSGMDRHLTYVAMTRHRDDVGLYAGRDAFPDFERLAGRLERGRLKASVLDYVNEAPERAPGDRPVPLLEPQRVFARTVAEVGRAEADAWLERRNRVMNRGLGLEAVFTDPEAVASRLREALYRPGSDPAAVEQLLKTKPETFGELRGRQRLLLGDDRERREAQAELPKVAWRVGEMLREWQRTYDHAVTKEEKRRVQAQVEIPGLSPAAERFLTAYGAVSHEEGNCLIAAALRTEEGRALMKEFERVSEVAVERGRAHPANSAHDKFQDIPGLDPERGCALAETVIVIKRIDREQCRIAYEQERALRRGLERGGPVMEL